MRTFPHLRTIPDFIGIVFVMKWRPLLCNWNGTLKKSLDVCELPQTKCW